MALNVLVDGNVIDVAPLNQNFNYCDALVPIGAILPWLKTFSTKDSGTTTSTVANKLVEAGQNFVTTISIGDVVYNTTDKTFAYVTAVDSDTQLALSADVCPTGKAYTIYATPALASNFVECNGQVLTDAGSKYNGATIPALNGATDSTSKFLRGALFSGTATATNTHSHSIAQTSKVIRGIGDDTSEQYNNTSSTGTTSHIPPSYTVVFIMRIK